LLELALPSVILELLEDMPVLLRMWLCVGFFAFEESIFEIDRFSGLITQN